MRFPSLARLPATLALLLLAAGCGTTPPGEPATSPPAAVPALQDPSFVNEVLRYVYRWHLDDDHFLLPARDSNIEIWSRPLHPALDADDRSEFAELWIPSARVAVELKRADYAIPELKLAVRDPGYRVARVQLLTEPPAAKSEFAVQRLPVKEVYDYLTRTRFERLPLPEGLRPRIREAIGQYLAKRLTNAVTGTQVVFVAPLSPVGNDLWVFWENERLVFHAAADMAMDNPAYWQHAPLRLNVIDLEHSVLVSREQVPGSNAFVTRDWMGRVLYNSVVLGERIELSADAVNRLISGAPAN